MKICTKCGKEKGLDEFAKSKKAKDGRKWACKSCSKEAYVKWQTSNPEKYKNAIKNYQSRDDIRIRKNEYERERRRKNPSYSLFMRVRRRCREEGIEFLLTPSDIVIPDVCPVLGIPLGHDLENDNLPTIDRLDSNGIYTRDNITVMSMRANRIKNNSTLEDLKKLVSFLEKNNGR